MKNARAARDRAAHRGELRLVSERAAGIDLDSVQSVEIEVRCRVRLDRGSDYRFMVLDETEVLSLDVTAVELREERRRKFSQLSPDSQTRLDELLEHMLIDAWFEPKR